MARFAFSFQPAYRPLAVAFGMGPARSWIDVGDDEVQVVMGWGFRAEVRRASIASIGRPAGRPVSRGAHGWAGRWLVNGSADGLVSLTIEPAGRGLVMGVPVRLRELTVSVEDPDGFVAALGPSA